MKYRQRPFYIFALALVAAVPLAWFLAGDAGFGTMIVTIILTFTLSTIYELLWRRITKQKP